MTSFFVHFFDGLAEVGSWLCASLVGNISQEELTFVARKLRENVVDVCYGSVGARSRTISPV